PPHGTVGRSNPYSAHQPSLLRSWRWEPAPANSPRLFCSRNGPSLGQIYRQPFEVGERAVAQRAFVGGTQDHARRLPRFERLLPTGCAQAPSVAGLETGKAEFRHRRCKIIAARFGEREKSGGPHRTHRVAATLLPPRLAAACA